MVRTPMPSESRTTDPRPSAAISRRAATWVPSDRVTSASDSRVRTEAVAVPGRKVTLGSSANRATISRRRSQLGRFQPKGWSDMSEASKSLTMRGSGTSPPASTMRMICKGAAWGSSRVQRPAACNTGIEGCRKAVVRRSAPASVSEVTGGVGSTQITRWPALPKAAAALSPATPPPEIRISVKMRAIRVPPAALS
ncbi:hypothetical protein GALL_462470 [mine drainage metagenome]|uniref:Uncharacterized protein n=1 Tax=mine drainage metagenome TaxID=410659 RepID=A0A1J5PX41_9ZZZZ